MNNYVPIIELTIPLVCQADSICRKTTVREVPRSSPT